MAVSFAIEMEFAQAPKLNEVTNMNKRFDIEGKN